MLERLLLDAEFVSIEIKPLATPGDLYLHTQAQFFGMLFNQIKRISSPWQRASYWTRLKVLWKAQQLLGLVGSGVVESLGPSDTFTLGYGFTAKKPAASSARSRS
jgi:hypothetical protein